MAHITLDNQTARRLFLDRHDLLAPPGGAGHRAGLLQVIERLGFVQLDSVNTLARAHDLILWSRRPTYRPADLRWLNDQMRGTFEHWTHDAAKIPMVFYPYWRRRFGHDAARLQKRWKNWHGPEFQGELANVLNHITTHGPIGSADMAPKGKNKTNGWWDWHPAKTALEYLWRSGQISVTRRDGFRKIYDLTERVIPAQYLGQSVDDMAIIDWACAGALSRLGFATPGELAAFWALITPAEARIWADQALRDGRIIKAEITLSDGRKRPVLTLPDIATQTAALPNPTPRIRVLSPFDPALRDRKRAAYLFGFDYRIEIFVPAAKRKYGYYVFPVMQGDRMIARVDMRADKAKGQLIVTRLWPEQGVAWGKTRQTAFHAELHRILPLANLDDIHFEKGWLGAL
jgi:uncharacterized protein YcaQ